MHYFLFIELEGFYANALEEQNRDLRGTAFVVHSEDLIIDVSPGAEDRGAERGMPLKECRALLREEGKFIEMDPDDFDANTAAWLDLCAECSGRVEPCSPASAFVDLSQHPHPLDTAAELLQRLHGLLHLNMAAGIAPTKWLAKLARIRVDEEALALGVPPIEAVVQPERFLQSVPVEMIEPLEPQIRERLILLGYRLAGQAQKADLNLLCKQFGQKGLTVWQSVRGGVHEPIKAEWPTEGFSRAVAFGASAVDNRLLFEHALDRLAQKASAELSLRAKNAQSVRLTVFDEDGKWVSDQRAFVKPVQTQKHLSVILNRMFDGLELTQAVMRIQASFLDLRDQGAYQQSLEGRTNKEERTASVETALKSVRSSQGRASVQMGSDIVLPRREKVLRAWRHAIGWS